MNKRRFNDWDGYVEREPRESRFQRGGGRGGGFGGGRGGGWDDGGAKRSRRDMGPEIRLLVPSKVSAYTFLNKIFMC